MNRQEEDYSQNEAGAAMTDSVLISRDTAEKLKEIKINNNFSWYALALEIDISESSLRRIIRNLPVQLRTKRKLDEYILRKQIMLRPLSEYEILQNQYYKLLQQNIDLQKENKLLRDRLDKVHK